MRSLPPASDTKRAPAEPADPTDFQSLSAAKFSERRPAKEAVATDFQTLKRQAFAPRKKLQKRTITDWLIEGLTPFMIFVMMYSVVSFLVEVRYVYLDLAHVDRIAQLYETTLRSTAFFFIMGIVALNRLVVRDGQNESVLYVIGMGISVALYTFTTTDQMGSLAHNFLNNPYMATLFNVMLVVIIWWVTNRLTHECCVDENVTAGEIGILTGTARRVHNAVMQTKLHTGTEQKGEDPYLYRQDLDAIDPTKWKKPERGERYTPETAVSRLPKRHPGISVFYAAIPSVACFVLGQWVLQTGPVETRLWAHMRLIAFTVAALSLLMLSSLAGLRQYFQERRAKIPAGIGPFWIGLGSLMIAAVIIGASRLPKPSLPIEAIQIRMQAAEKVAQPQSTADLIAKQFPTLATYLYIGEILVLVAMGLVALYAFLRIVGASAMKLSTQQNRIGRRLARFFRALDQFLQRILRIPSLPTFRRGRKIQRDVALSGQYVNPLSDPILSREMSPSQIVEYSYSALCALAEDMGVPRQVAQTPYEFIQQFPKEMATLRDDAINLTNLYVVSAYSEFELDERTLDTVRGFWRSFIKVRGAVLN